jgi:acetyltransferase-like isoleucine patch superfamily enzyme
MRLISRTYDRASRLSRYLRAIITAYRFGRCGSGLQIWGPFQIKNGQLLTCGDNLSINDYVYINAYGGIHLGNDVTLSAGSMLISTSLDTSLFFLEKVHVSQPICIGNRVQIGANAIVLGGVTIGNNVIVGACSLVTHDIPDDSIATGIPAKVVRALPTSQTKGPLP